LNMTTIFPKVDDNAVRPGQFNEHRCTQGVRICSAPGLAQGGHMVDIDTESSHSSLQLELI